jgi:N-acetylmuramic acid 6-phosphate etherase
MVDVVATNAKLRRRSLRLVASLTGLDDVAAAELLERCEGRVKVAVLAARRNLEPHAARASLEAAAGSLRTALDRPPAR